MTASETEIDLIVRRDDLHETRIRRRALPTAVADGSVLMRIDRFALTANNVTYAAFGDAMSYWDFFPSAEDGWGRVPVWGFGTVVESRCDGVAVGERFFGYFPMSTHVVVVPGKVGAAGFVDAAPHRAALHALYNQYLRNAVDPLYDVAREAHELLLRPLFITSFVIDDFLADNDFFGAAAVILSSASSKTAAGLAWQLAARRPDGPAVTGLTSPRHRPFVEGLGCYDRVVAYDAIDSLPVQPAVYIDFAGDRALRAALHRHFGDDLRHSAAVGSSHWDAAPASDDAPLPGAKPTFFFAPAQIRKRTAEWGAAGFQERFAAAWHRFVARVDDAERPWLRVVAAEGPEAVERVYRSLLDGQARPDEGMVVSLRAS